MPSVLSSPRGCGRTRVRKASPATAVKTIASVGKTQVAPRAYIARYFEEGITKVNGVKEYRYFAGGEWRAAEDHKLFDVFRPYDRGLYARVAKTEDPR